MSTDQLEKTGMELTAYRTGAFWEKRVAVATRLA